jgi:RND family efflux transporter MFP subunit
MAAVRSTIAGGGRGRIVRIAGGVALALAVVLMLLWLVGVFRPKVDAGGPGAAAIERPVAGTTVAIVRTRTLARSETAVGTIEPVHRIELASRILARVLAVHASAGRRVAAGETLVELDDADLRARAAQASAAVDAAQAELDQARIEEASVRAVIERGAGTAIELERATSARRSAEAALDRAEEALAEAKIVLAYASIASPIDGVVIDKRVSAGDMVAPGQVVVALLDPSRMQLVASVRESLSRRFAVGDRVMVRVDALAHVCEGTVSEIVPESAVGSRSFQVKVTGPCPEGVHAGMFGRLAIPMGEEEVLVVPRGAVRRVGQVDLVEVAEDGLRRRRAVRVGRTIDDDVEILAGLRAGESVVAEGDGGRSGTPR